MSLRGPLYSLKTHLKELLEGHNIRLINIRNKNSFSDTNYYEIYYETNFNNWQIGDIMRELEQLCPSVDFEFDVNSYEMKKVTKVVRKRSHIRFRHRIQLMATQLESSLEN